MSESSRLRPLQVDGETVDTDRMKRYWPVFAAIAVVIALFITQAIVQFDIDAWVRSRI